MHLEHPFWALNWARIVNLAWPRGKTRKGRVPNDGNPASESAEDFGKAVESAAKSAELPSQHRGAHLSPRQVVSSCRKRLTRRSARSREKRALIWACC